VPAPCVERQREERRRDFFRTDAYYLSPNAPWPEWRGQLEPRRAKPGEDRIAPPRRIAATYDYTDASGAVIYQVVRFEPKEFGQRQPAPNEPGLWVWGLSAGEYMRARAGQDWYRFKPERWDRYPQSSRQLLTLPVGVPHGLYRYWDDVCERGDDEIAYLPEGEKDVDALAALGLAATTNSGGADHWTAEHAAALAGREVVILIDNDEPGRKRGAKVAKSLAGVARRVRVLDFAASWPDMPQKADVSDWIASGGTADLLRALVDNLGEWTPEPFASRYGLVWFNDLNIDHGAEHAWLIDDWLSAGDVSMNYGASRSGKSFLAIHAAMCVARGIRLFGHDVQRGGVVYQAGEEAKGIKNRFRAYRKHFEVSDNERVPLAVLRSPIDLYRPDGDTAGLVAEIKALAELMPVPLALVVIDTLATATAGADENSAKDMSAVLANIGKIARAGSCHVMLVHHKNASGDKPRGHTSVFANLDNAIEVAFNQSTGLRVASNAKQKDDEEAEPIRFELMRVDIGFRPNGKPITSCVCLPVGEKDAALKAQAAQGVRLRGSEAIVYRALCEAILEHGERPPARPTIPSDVRVVRFSRWREALERLANIDEPDPKKLTERIKKRECSS
jgi:AAA domain